MDPVTGIILVGGGIAFLLFGGKKKPKADPYIKINGATDEQLLALVCPAWQSRADGEKATEIAARLLKSMYDGKRWPTTAGSTKNAIAAFTRVLSFVADLESERRMCPAPGPTPGPTPDTSKVSDAIIIATACSVLQNAVLFATDENVALDTAATIFPAVEWPSDLAWQVAFVQRVTAIVVMLVAGTIECSDELAPDPDAPDPDAPDPRLADVGELACEAWVGLLARGYAMGALDVAKIVMKAVEPSGIWPPPAYGTQADADLWAAAVEIVAAKKTQIKACENQVLSPLAATPTPGAFYLIKSADSKHDNLLNIVEAAYPWISSGMRTATARLVNEHPRNVGLHVQTTMEWNKQNIGPRMVSFFPKWKASPKTMIDRYQGGNQFAVIWLPEFTP
jgi:hypothetical protein